MPIPKNGLHIPTRLPYGWERRRLDRHELERLWGEGMMILRVINLMDAHAPREGEVDAPTTRLEAKLDLALHLLALNLHGVKPLPTPAPIILWSEGCAFDIEESLQPGDGIVLGLHLSSALALPLKLAASVVTTADGECHANWIAMPDSVREAWEQWLFRQHRRMVQEQRSQK